MNAIDKPPKLRPRRLLRIITATLIVTIVCLLVLVALAVKQARHAALRLFAESRLSQIRLALQNYETANGALPPLCLRDKQGKPIQSWRALILPYTPYAEREWPRRLDLCQPWNSDSNRKVIESIPPAEWVGFARDRPTDQWPAHTHIFALVGPDSIWDAKTGLPKGKTKRRPDKILLISVPESNVEPLQPEDITEDKVRKLVEDGQEVLFIMAGVQYGYGAVKIEGGSLVFPTWQEELERSGRRLRGRGARQIAAGIAVRGASGYAQIQWVLLPHDTEEGKMKTYRHSTAALLLMAVALCGCGPSSEETKAEAAKQSVKQGDELAAKGDSTAAIARYSEAIRLDWRCPEAYRGRGNVYSAMDEPDKAIADYSMAIKLNLKDANVYEARGKAYWKKDESEKSVADYTEAIRLRPKSAPLLCERAARCKAMHEREKAVADYTEAIRLDANCLNAHRGRAACLAEMGKFADAAADCTAVIRLKPDAAEAYDTRSIAYASAGQFDKAIDDLTQAIRLGRKGARTYCRRAEMYTRKRDWDKALADCTEAIRLDPKSVGAYGLRAVCHFGMGKYSDAVADCTEAIRLKPDDLHAYASRGRAYATMGEMKKAIADLSEAVRLNPKDVQLYANRAEMYLRNREFGKAAADLTEAIRLDPGQERRGVRLSGDLSSEPGPVFRCRGRLQRGHSRQPALGQRLRHSRNSAGKNGRHRTERLPT